MTLKSFAPSKGPEFPSCPHVHRFWKASGSWRRAIASHRTPSHGLVVGNHMLEDMVATISNRRARDAALQQHRLV